MGSTTSKLALYKPSVGEADWGDLVNANFDTLDDALVDIYKEYTLMTATPLSVVVTDEVIVVDMDQGEDFNINLPQVSSSNRGQTLYIKLASSDAYTLYINSYSGQTIDGDTSYSTSTVGSYLMIVSNGSTGWYILNNSGFSVV